MKQSNIYHSVLLLTLSLNLEVISWRTLEEKKMKLAGLLVLASVCSIEGKTGDKIIFEVILIAHLQDFCSGHISIDSRTASHTLRLLTRSQKLPRSVRI